MISERLENISYSPFVLHLTFAVLKSIKTRELVEEDRDVIDSDLVPQVSERVMQASLARAIDFTSQLENPKPSEDPKPTPIVLPPKKEFGQELVAPIVPKKRPVLAPRPAVKMPQAPIHSQDLSHELPPSVSEYISQGPTNDYGKIQQLLLDPSVSTIECPGPGKPLSVLRAGQKEFTRIVLSAEEIQEILVKVADSTHIPIMEGVFRAAVDNFSINAVVSEMVGSKFIIKKQTPYSILENHTNP